jgi:hypothetical protein
LSGADESAYFYLLATTELCQAGKNLEIYLGPRLTVEKPNLLTVIVLQSELELSMHVTVEAEFVLKMFS